MSSLPPEAVHTRLLTALGPSLRRDEPLSRHTTFQIGGPAQWYFEARTAEALVAALRLAHALGIEVHLIGGGSNLLVSDAGLPGLTLRNAIDEVAFDDGRVRVGGGADYLGLIERCRDHARAGLAYAAGIPGSVGGAVYGNAGCYGQDIGGRLVEGRVVALDGSAMVTRPHAWFGFAYRDSHLKRADAALVDCVLALDAGDATAITAEIEEKLAIRRAKHPQWRSEPTAGSYFKNLPPGFQVPGLPHSPGTQRIPAGALLDACDCRGLRVGGAMVFPRHANILVNAGGATAQDVLVLAELMKARVRERFAVELEAEVMFLGARPDLSAVTGQTA
jgi:UDP-N-acetylmuramate dehydrogenase